jgi:hypothetical protein
MPSGLLRAQNNIHNMEDWHCRANIPPRESPVDRVLASKSGGRTLFTAQLLSAFGLGVSIYGLTNKHSTWNLFQPGSVHRDEETQTGSPIRRRFEFVRPEGKRRHMAVGFSVIGGLLLVGFAVSRLKTRREARKDVLKLF